MQSKDRRRAYSCLALALIALPVAGAALADLAATRDGLLADLQERNQQWDERDASRWLFRFEYGLLHRHRKVGFRRDGRRETHLAWTTTRLGDGWSGSQIVAPELDILHCLDHELHVEQSDAGLRGQLRLQLQRGNWLRNMESYTTNMQGVVKSNTIPVLDYAIGLARQRPAWQSWEFTADGAADALFIEGQIKGAIDRKDPHDLQFTCLWRPGVGVLAGWGWTPSFNRAAHRIARADLRLVDGRLRGWLEAEVRRDAWLPRGVPPIGFLTQRWQLDLPLHGGRIDGMAASDGELGPRSNRLRARVWQAQVGSYRSDGVDGPRQGRAIIGHAPLATNLPAKLPTEDPAAIYGQIADLIAHRQDPLGQYESGSQDCYLPASTADQRAAWQRLGDFAGAAAAAPAPAAVQEVDPAFGPFYGDATELQPTDAAASVFDWPDADGDDIPEQHWLRVPSFRGYGPLRQDGQAGDWTDRPLPLLPEIAGGGLSVPGLGPASWTTIRDGDRDRPPAAVTDALAAAEVRHPLWYAGATIRCRAAVDSWLAVRIAHQGCLYLNGVRIWRSPARHSPEATAVIPVQLQAGDNEFLLRVGGRQGFGRYAQGKGGPGHCSLHLCQRGEPRPATELPPPHPPSRPDPTPPEAVPLPAWHLDSDTNVAWRRALRCRHDPLPIAAGVVVAADDGSLRCLAATDGAERWRLRLEQPGGWGQAIAADGDILVAHGSGLVLRLDEDGTERWRCSAPALVGQPADLLLGSELLIGFQGGDTGATIVAFDPTDGRQRWQTRLQQSDGIRSAALVPAVPAKPQALVTDSGQLIALGDGQLIGTHLAPGQRAPAAPLVHGRRMILRAGEVGVDLVEDGAGRLGSRLAWAVERYTHYGYPDWPQADPGICSDGLIYVLRDAPEHSTHGPFPASHLYQIDSQTGHMTGYRKRFLMNALQPSDLRCTGGLIAAADLGGDVFGGEDRGPQIGIAASADPPLILGVSQGSSSGRAPLADGAGGWYLIDGDSLLRLAWGQPTERAMALRRAVQSIAAWDLGPRPQRQEVLDLPALQPAVDADRWPVESLVPYGGPIRWLVDIIAPADADAPLAADLAAGPSGWDGLLPLDPSILYHSVLNGEVDGRNAYIARTGIDPLQLLDRQPHSQRHLAGLLRVDRSRVYEVDIDGAGVQAWIGGQRLQDRQLVRLAPGDHALVLRVSLGKVKPFMKRLRAAVTFLPAIDPAIALAEWEAQVRARAPWLRALRRQAPDSDGAAHIDFLLQAIATGAD